MQILPGRNRLSSKAFCIRMRQSCSRAFSRVSSLSPDSVFHLNFPLAKHENSKSRAPIMIAELRSNDSLEKRRFCEVIKLTNQVRSGTLYSPQWAAAHTNTTTTMADASPLLLWLHALITPRVRYTSHKKKSLRQQTEPRPSQTRPISLLLFV